MQGVSINTLGDIGGLLAGIVGFVILVAGYVFIIDKKPIRSDYMFYFFLVNVALLTGVVVSWYYKADRQITAT